MEGKQDILSGNLSGLLCYLTSVSKVKCLMRFMGREPLGYNIKITLPYESLLIFSHFNGF